MSKLALYGGSKVADQLTPWPLFDETDEAALLETLRSRRWFRSEGAKNQEFERLFADFCDAKYGLTVTNGTAALEIALSTLNLQKEDEVIVPSYTFYSTASSVAFSGAKPVFADIDADNYNIDLDHFEELINERTKAVIPVHFAGYPVDMDRLNAIARKKGIFVIEDSAHAHGASYKNRKVGSLCNVATFSFQASKNLTSGEGGILTTNDENLYDKMYSRHTCGRHAGRPWYEHFEQGSNLRMTEFQAALLLAQFNRFEKQFEERRQNGRILEDWISQSPFFEQVQTPTFWSVDRSYHLFMFRYKPGVEGVLRTKFIEALNAEGVPTLGGYPYPLYKQPVYENLTPPFGKPEYHSLCFPNVEKCCQETVWISQNALLGGTESSRKIISAFEKIIQNADELRNS
ncbi:MAG: DegT/DnrJ/EryC1/StrS family aminotransferase [Planctomycetia bacterium]|nr:DegT/DnrJ/EryC1/StrS family aminotransferase [Planctomycetia bacterium]